MVSMYHLQSIKITMFLCFKTLILWWWGNIAVRCGHSLQLGNDYTALLSRNALPNQEEIPPQMEKSSYSHSEYFWSWSNSSGVRETHRSSFIFKPGVSAWGQGWFCSPGWSQGPAQGLAHCRNVMDKPFGRFLEDPTVYGSRRHLSADERRLLLFLRQHPSVCSQGKFRNPCLSR